MGLSGSSGNTGQAAYSDSTMTPYNPSADPATSAGGFGAQFANSPLAGGTVPGVSRGTATVQGALGSKRPGGPQPHGPDQQVGGPSWGGFGR